MSESKYDVLVIGGSAAGLSGALILARSRRSVLVIDAGEPRNSPADAMHNFLSRDGTNPRAFLELGRAEVRGYSGAIVSGRVRSLTRASNDVFVATLEDGRVFTARRVLVTTGLADELPDIPGVRERWGRDVIHCPYCHGWEVRDQPIGVLSSGPMSLHQALLFRQLTSDLVVFTHTSAPFSDEQLTELAARDIRVVSGPVKSLEVDNDRLTGVRMLDGSFIPRQAVVVAPRFVANARVLESIGLTPSQHPTGGEYIVATDPTGRTEVAGVWVAGNVTDLAATVIAAAAQGTLAGAMISADLVLEDTRRAVAYAKNRAA
jgi:thioredoxin reductase